MGVTDPNSDRDEAWTVSVLPPVYTGERAEPGFKPKSVVLHPASRSEFAFLSLKEISVRRQLRMATGLRCEEQKDRKLLETTQEAQEHLNLEKRGL